MDEGARLNIYDPQVEHAQIMNELTQGSISANPERGEHASYILVSDLYLNTVVHSNG